MIYVVFQQFRGEIVPLYIVLVPTYEELVAEVRNKSVIRQLDTGVSSRNY